MEILKQVQCDGRDVQGGEKYGKEPFVKMLYSAFIGLAMLAMTSCKSPVDPIEETEIVININNPKTTATQ